MPSCCISWRCRIQKPLSSIITVPGPIKAKARKGTGNSKYDAAADEVDCDDDDDDDDDGDDDDEEEDDDYCEDGSDDYDDDGDETGDGDAEDGDHVGRRC